MWLVCMFLFLPFSSLSLCVFLLFLIVFCAMGLVAWNKDDDDDDDEYGIVNL